jgi:hypothetical protein
VNKPKDGNYTLYWKEEPDFVRLASKVGALIVPFAAVGADDAYEVCDALVAILSSCRVQASTRRTAA